MNSLRLRLFALIAAATVLVWSVAAVWTTVSAQRDIERVLDRRLREAAHMVASLGSSAVVAPMPNDLPNTTDYERQLSCQVWSLRGELVGRSSSAPAIPLAEGRAGFSQRTIDGVEWRVYTYIVPKRGLRVMVGDTVAMRRNLVTDLMTGLIVPAVLGLLALAVLIWIGTGRGLTPLRRVADAVEARAPDDLSPLAAGAIPRELSVVTDAIDALLDRLARLRDNERHFLASAAHELQTPLAGLKTQVQIARRSDDPVIRANALQRIESSVDRTTRLVRQLLDLARQEGADLSPAAAPIVLGEAVVQVRDELVSLLARHHATLAIRPEARCCALMIEPQTLLLALRNLIENAVMYGPDGQVVMVSLTIEGNDVRLTVEDEGPGLSDREGEALRQRFVRGKREILPGSGLGLSIVDAALVRIGARLSFERREPNGTRATIAIPAELLAKTHHGLATDPANERETGGDGGIRTLDTVSRMTL